VPIVRHHHENWNGTGYPDRLKGTEIPIGARILSVVDCFDALTSDRPYRRQLSEEEAVGILMERRGSMYDPLIVDTFVRVNTIVLAEVDRKGPGSEVLRAIASSHGSSSELEETGDSNAGERPSVQGVARAIASHTHHDPDAIATDLRALVQFSTCVVYEYDVARDELRPWHIFGESLGALDSLRIPLGQNLSGWVAATRTTIRNSDPMLDLSEVVSPARMSVGSCLSTPIISEGVLIGVLTLYSNEVNSFGDEQEERTEQLARAIGAFRAQNSTN